VQISVYSHKAEVHDAITKLPGSFRRTIEGARLLKECGVKVSFANVLMQHNANDYREVQALAAQLGVAYNVDATITPMMDGDRSILDLNVDPIRWSGCSTTRHSSGTPRSSARRLRAARRSDALDTLPCSAGHTACYVSPYGDVYPCVQFPYLSGNVRTVALSRHLAELAAAQRSARRSAQATCKVARPARMARVAHGVRGLRISKETCAGRRPRIARSRLRAPACRREICSRKRRCTGTAVRRLGARASSSATTGVPSNGWLASSEPALREQFGALRRRRLLTAPALCATTFTVKRRTEFGWFEVAKLFGQWYLPH
jgi:sulfatase maturation enzyme AslB (radical SAM superfamily)